MKNNFSKKLFDWYHLNKRSHPWAGEHDPYLIWLSEIIMQQTRVEQGLKYYQKFKAAFPTIFHLAKAREDKVMKMWEGLGYYSRVRNMHHTAKEIVNKYNGEFPSEYEKIIKLKGIGKYTASAILSFAWNKPFAVVDGNILRIISRIYGINDEINSTQGRKKIGAIAHKLLDKKNPGIFNQAMMDFGALICKPVNPKCGECPFSKNCYAFNQDVVDLFPVKKKKEKKKIRYFNFLIIKDADKIIIEKRTQKDIWKNLYQFPLIETKTKLSTKKLIHQPSFKKIFKNIPEKNIPIAIGTKIFNQQLTHQNINASFFIIKMEDLKDICITGAQEIKISNLKNYAFPGAIRLFLKELSIFIA